MRDSDYYPAGAYSDPSAPYNQVEVPERDFCVTISQSLSKSTIVTTNDYIPCVEEGCDDGVGYHDEWADTSDTDWKKVYSDCSMTPLDIIKACESLAKQLLEQGVTCVGPYNMESLIEECQDWDEDELEVVED